MDEDVPFQIAAGPDYWSQFEQPRREAPRASASSPPQDYWRQFERPAAEALPLPPPSPPGETARAQTAADDQRRWAETPWSSVARQAVGNIPSSALNVANNLYQTVRHPLDTASGLGQIGTGLYSKAEGLFRNQDPEQKARDEALVNAIGADYAQRYGTLGGFKRALATDPFSVGMDVSLPLTVGAGTVPGLAGRGLGLAAKLADPVQGAASVAGLAGRTAMGATRLTQAAASGIPHQIYEIASEAARSPDAGMRNAFWQFQRGSGNINEIANTARNAFDELRENASKSYLSSMDGIRANQMQLPFSAVDQAMAQERAALQIGGQRLPQMFAPANDMLNRIDQNIAAFRAMPPEMHTMENFDRLKKSIRDLADQSGNTVAQQAAERIAQAARNTVATADPRYAEIMEAYQAYLREANNWSKTLGTNDRTATAASIAKIMRQTKTPQGRDLLNSVAQTEAGKYLPAMLAGAITHQTLPDSLHALMAGGMSAAMWGANPWYPAVHAAFASPAIGGLSNYGVGAAQRYAQTPLRMAGKMVPDEVLRALPDNMAHYGLYYPSALPERAGRADGGKVTHERLVSRLMKLADEAKKASNANTKPLLGVHDNAIAKALQTADAAI